MLRDHVIVLSERHLRRLLRATRWHDYIGEPTLADAICDRLLHNAHRIVLQGPSGRKEPNGGGE